ncbi:hypothetical protein NDU88_001905 [Pleurodeles waltl]|uniref:Uncharacterized protein n=1 Tax=Pleurodeles waltl TaxID=8319 RepID=A0AAV7WJR0_PLEWA|nr:hypothetical protein NDU88_001905 [Pleurodeles waltl]
MGPAPSEGDGAPLTRAFMEQLFGSLREDFAMLKQDIAADIKDLKKEVIDLGQRVDSVEQTQDVREEELDCHRRELLTLQDKKLDLQYQIEALENRSRHSNIRIKGIPAQAVAGSLEDFVVRLFRHRLEGMLQNLEEWAQMEAPLAQQRSPGRDRLKPNNRQCTTQKPSTVKRQKEKAALIRSPGSQDSVPEEDSDH